MGNRRIGRKRLYAVEKAGQKIDLESGPGIAGAIKSASQHRNGQEIITEIAVDLQGDSSTVIRTAGASGSSGDRSPIGVDATSDSSLKAYITQLTTAKYGIITEIRAILVEALDSSAGSPPAIGLESGATGDGRCIIANGSGTDGGTRVQLIEDLNVLGEDISKELDDSSAINDKYLYIVQEAHETAADTLTAGKVLIYIHGFEAPADI